VERLPVKVGKETMVGKTANALCPIDASGRKVFVKGECDQRYVGEKKDEPYKSLPSKD
jgi:hypothetical protein